MIEDIPESVIQTYQRIRTRDGLAEIGLRAREHVVENYLKEAPQSLFATFTVALTNTDSSTPTFEDVSRD